MCEFPQPSILRVNCAFACEESRNRGSAPEGDTIPIFAQTRRYVRDPASWYGTRGGEFAMSYPYLPRILQEELEELQPFGPGAGDPTRPDRARSGSADPGKCSRAGAGGAKSGSQRNRLQRAGNTSSVSVSSDEGKRSRFVLRVPALAVRSGKRAAGLPPRSSPVPEGPDGTGVAPFAASAGRREPCLLVRIHRVPFVHELYPDGRGGEMGKRP